MAFSPERFDEQLDLLTKPELGLVTPTAIPDVYQLLEDKEQGDRNKRDLVVLTGPSGAGKDSILGDMLDKNAAFAQAKTASTRGRRPNETPDAMTWMRAKHPGEGEEEYIKNLIHEYDLAEHSLHHGDLYGLPRSNLTAIPREKIPLLNTDTDGIASLTRSLREDYTLTSIMVCPESATQLEDRLHSTGRHSLGRLVTAQAYLDDAARTANYILVNREEQPPHAAISKSADKVLRLLDTLDITR